ncbi:hypothetical protein, unlikely [Trypanosoma brucei gambiense DAL972]|uniref:Uncharacterized protein n=3 Tax=Trypanosoma brucei TaxID=5691 RepID=Q4GYR4_TRYB2|nr:hypothetical protein, unlikely [Trypanosoma brucei brucei TREU927]XP_011771460.1 hypothetical protein, unlikely [Trypanosoma brucei gambiense DAL972]RHW74494.1 hypothetical protein DPX39_010032200 [Trypanosoma brucei equiperdum]CAJ16520.1 hypothetical protein, unlikely [Trypanosoma brucei brucei TREU927]CBH09019.1 hypothetical protein, unlikely [Trypanosoma brucei gambiense DAL972]|eukprot:XP_011771460.1 hypothetical protein, unlikely [Trypanosoma brucei gambiense DAL972]
MKERKRFGGRNSCLFMGVNCYLQCPSMQLVKVGKGVEESKGKKLGVIFPL